MDKADVLTQIAQFDHSRPINVTIVFEDSDDEPTSHQELQEHLKNIVEDQKQENSVKKCETEYLKNNKNIEDLKENVDLNKGSNNDMVKITIFEDVTQDLEEHRLHIHEQNEKNTRCTNDDEIAKHITNSKDMDNQRDQNNTVPCQDLTVNDIRKDITVDNVSAFIDESYENDPVIFIDELLNTLSEHLILIMLAYNRYQVRRNTDDNLIVTEALTQKNNKVFISLGRLKAHFFELSYTTMVSIILPHIQNENFINTFLDNTVKIANSKPLKWKCQRYHVEIFFNELVMWSKLKKERLKSFNLRVTANENNILIEHLNRPPKFPNSNLNIQNSSDPKEPGNLCIFSAGAPGSEISININPDILINTTQTQSNNSVERTGIQNTCAEGTAPIVNPPIAAPPHKSQNKAKIQQKNKTQNNRRNPPSYNAAVKAKKLNEPVQLNQNMVQSVKNYYQNFDSHIPNHLNARQLVDTHQYERQPQQNHLNARHLINKRPNVIQATNFTQASQMLPHPNPTTQIQQQDNFANLIQPAQNPANVRYQNHLNERLWLQNHPNVRLHPLGNHPTDVQPLQSNQNVDQSMQRYQTQLHYSNSTRWSPDSGYSEYLQDNRNNSQQHGPYFNQNQMSSGPIITNVTSLLPSERRSTNGWCCMCGKTTNVTCTKCNQSSYCSRLCQWLDWQVERSQDRSQGTHQ